MFICNLCNKEFKYKSKLEEHKNRKTKCNIIKDNTNCDICNINFNFKSDLELHFKSKKHININNIQIANNITNNFNNINNNVTDTTLVEDELQQRLQLKEYEINKLQKENEDKLNKLKKENELLKFNFEENIKINLDNEIERELVPISNDIITHKTLNKININDILAKYYKLLNITDLLYIINYDLNKLYVDKFWNNIESEDWIYLDEELINWFGYKEISRGKEQLIKIIKREFEIEEDYKILNNEEIINTKIFSGLKPEIKLTKNIHHIIIKPDCFKLTCLQVGTSKSKGIYKYFLEIEQIFKFYLKYTSEFNKYELEKSKLIKNRYINKTEIKLDSILYLITTRNKAKENIFKFGSTINEKSRKVSYNTGNVEAEKFFYVATYNCYDAMTLERRIAKLLINFKIPNESEMYQLHFTALDNIIKEACKNDNYSINKINNFISEEYNKYLNLEPIKF